RCRRIWKPAVVASVGEPMRFHDLRHSHVAALIATGEHPKVIASRLGHTSVRTILDVYTCMKASTRPPRTVSTP
ncbi:MAG: tyrosine-type recombinase/integrase, partial [Acidimicrobiia bacterium]